MTNLYMHWTNDELRTIAKLLLAENQRVSIKLLNAERDVAIQASEPDSPEEKTSTLIEDLRKLTQTLGTWVCNICETGFNPSASDSHCPLCGSDDTHGPMSGG